MSGDEFKTAANKPNVDLVNVPYPTKGKLLHLIGEQSRLLDRMEPAPRPSWAMDQNDERRKQYREVSRGITRTTNRLQKATSKFENDFDMSS